MPPRSGGGLRTTMGGTGLEPVTPSLSKSRNWCSPLAQSACLARVCRTFLARTALPFTGVAPLGQPLLLARVSTVAPRPDRVVWAVMPGTPRRRWRGAMIGNVGGPIGVIEAALPPTVFLQVSTWRPTGALLRLGPPLGQKQARRNRDRPVDDGAVEVGDIGRVSALAAGNSENREPRRDDVAVHVEAEVAQDAVVYAG